MRDIAHTALSDVWSKSDASGGLKKQRIKTYGHVDSFKTGVSIRWEQHVW